MKFQKNLPLVTLALGGVFIVLFAVDSYFSDSKKSEQLWQKVSTKNTISAYEKYLSQDGKYKNLAKQKLIALKQDKLNFKNSMSAGTLSAIKQYLSKCKNTICLNQDVAKDILLSVKTLEQEFNQHIKNNNLSSGNNGSALQNLEYLQQLLPNDHKINIWVKRLSDKYLQLSKQASKKRQQKQAKKFIILANELTKNYISQSNDMDLKKLKDKVTTIKILAIKNNPDELVDYLEECGSVCYETIDPLRNKAEKYIKIKQSFDQKINKKQLSSAKKELSELKRLFPKSEQIDLWKREIADEFFLLAKQNNDGKSEVYIDKGLSIYPNHFGLQSLKDSQRKLKQHKQTVRLNKLKQQQEYRLNQARITSRNHKNKERRDLLNKYKKVKATKRFNALRDYIESCSEDCPNYELAQNILVEAEIIIDDFTTHTDEKLLLHGASGYALLDLQKFKKLFPNDYRIKKWHKIISTKLAIIINNYISHKQYRLAKKELKLALKVYPKNKKLLRLKTFIKIHIHNKNSKLVPKMIRIKGDGFSFGGNFRYARTKHWIHLKPFRISETEITFDQYRQYARAKRIRLHSSGWGKGRRPAINISWDRANGYTKWLSRKTGRNFRLPSEAEWSFVARNSKVILSPTRMNKNQVCKYSNGADKSTGFPWKNRQCNDRFGDRTAPVKFYLPNKFGVYDMQGNVWEWMADCWHSNIRNIPKDNRAWIRGGNCNRRVIKGGGWNSSVHAMLPGYRSSALKNIEYNYIGFRIVEEL